MSEDSSKSKWNSSQKVNIKWYNNINKNNYLLKLLNILLTLLVTVIYKYY